MMRGKKRARRVGEEEKEPDVESAADEDDVLVVRESIYFAAAVESKHVLKLLKALDEASDFALKHATWPTEARVYLYIHSGGGDAFAGLSAMDHIRNNRVPVVTIADGYVASAATFMLLGGYERKSLQNAKILIHQLSTAFWGKYVDLLDEAENCRELMESFRRVYADNTRLRPKELESLLSKELHMNARRCLECGVVDELW